jgi:hypothetical protein
MEKAKLIRMRVDQQVEGAEYLPLTEPGMEKAYLLRGTWQETWTYDVCGREVDVPIVFRADGFGGAYYTAESKRSPPLSP